MKRVVEMKDVASVLDSLAEIEYKLALESNRDLFEVQLEINERIMFLYLIGLVSSQEREKMFRWSEDVCKKNLAKKEEAELLDVGF